MVEPEEPNIAEATREARSGGASRERSSREGQGLGGVTGREESEKSKEKVEEYMAYRISTVCITAHLLSSFPLTYAARPEPTFADVTPVETLHEVYHMIMAEAESADVEKSCEGVGEDECLVRRTLTAQNDHIYTQKHKP
ncbi:hypothetical protein SADUNF_Sadunf08G0166500 [Salix dunnii]|uniref:Phytosulfokine n=1 Tax=Salix dunnii TaxID=1413687 RepID=A0A835K1X3_9ROSI|nr:hypothetical protein SADUNF_Sadunf08G0166500 [Salix dunnii]